MKNYWNTIHTFCIRSKQIFLTFCLQKRSHSSVFSIDQVVKLSDTSCKRQNVSNLWSVDCNWSSKNFDLLSIFGSEDFTLKSAYLKSFLHNVKLGTMVLRAQKPTNVWSYNKISNFYIIYHIIKNNNGFKLHTLILSK